MKRSYSIYDVRTRQYDDPWTSPNDDTAIRTVSTGVNKPGNHTLHLYPEDFALFYVGDFDPETGVTINMEEKVLVRQCLAMVEQEPFEMSNGVDYDARARERLEANPAVQKVLREVQGASKQ